MRKFNDFCQIQKMNKEYQTKKLRNGLPSKFIEVRSTESHESFTEH